MLESETNYIRKAAPYNLSDYWEAFGDSKTLFEWMYERTDLHEFLKRAEKRIRASHDITRSFHENSS